jgi:hypothetical protein
MHGECGTKGEGENVYKFSVKKSGRKRPLGRYTGIDGFHGNKVG